MRYYLLDNRIEYQTKDSDGKVIGYKVKQPVFMKQYPYYKLTFSPDGAQCIVQTEMEVLEDEAVELTLAQAQEQTNEWTKDYEKVIQATEVYDEEKQKVVVVEELVDATPLDIKSFDCDRIKIRTSTLALGVMVNG